MSSCTDGLLDPPIILARMLETTCSINGSLLSTPGNGKRCNLHIPVKIVCVGVAYI